MARISDVNDIVYLVKNALVCDQNASSRKEDAMSRLDGTRSDGRRDYAVARLIMQN